MLDLLTLCLSNWHKVQRCDDQGVTDPTPADWGLVLRPRSLALQSALDQTKDSLV